MPISIASCKLAIAGEHMYLVAAICQIIVDLTYSIELF